MAVGDTISTVITQRDFDAVLNITLVNVQRLSNGSIEVTLKYETELSGLAPGSVAAQPYFLQGNDTIQLQTEVIGPTPATETQVLEINPTASVRRVTIAFGVAASPGALPDQPNVPAELTAEPPAPVGAPDEVSDPTTITDLTLEFEQAPLSPSGATPTVVTGTQANGEQTQTIFNESYDSDDTGVVTVSRFGTVFAEGVGTATVTVSLETEVGVVQDSADITVERTQQPVSPQPQPSDASRFRFPFSIFNAIPGITEAEDFIVTVPQIGEISDLFETQVPTVSDIAQAVSSEVTLPELPDVPSTADIREELLVGPDTATLPTITNVRTELQTTVGEIEIPEPPAVEDITEPVDNTIDALQEDLEGVIDDTEAFLDESISATEGVLTDTLDGIDSAVRDAQESIDAVGTDITDGFSDVQEAIDELPDSVPSLEDIVADTTDAVITEIEAQIIPTQEGVLLTADPPRFFAIAIENFLQEALSESTKRQIGNSVAEER
jgi:ElaB/YqjD/DUF883 family membrane-anchored ribosome-binding protein